jgi:D-beta-D-heptose 7-phosphate kinase / D-beta-D-heptose 1-phosphate adenosyltransferase
MINFLANNPKILVLGDLIIDDYLWGSSERISPEAPVQIVNISKKSTVLGGAGNVVKNLNALGAEVDIISVIGDCKVSIEVKNLLSQIDVKTSNLVTEKNRITSKKSRVISSNQQVIRYDFESINEINSQSQKIILDKFSQMIINYDLVLLSDYGKGLLTKKLTQSLIKIAKKYKKKVLVDPKGQDYSKYNGAFLLTPNMKEASESTHIDIKDSESLFKAITHLKKQCNLKISLITMSDQGVAVFDKKLRIHPTSALEVFDVTGAGDTVLASLGFALSCDSNIDDAVKFANLASGVVVGKIGSASATINEILEYESSLNQSSSSQHIKTFKEITAIVDELKNKNKNKKIIFTNGCFDILHIGHVQYLEKAKSFGDILIIGLNSDLSVKNLKGKNRPINSQSNRAYILAALEVVDYVVIFDEDTPLELIELIKPDILVKGSDYKGKEVIGSEIAKELRLVEFIQNSSTSEIIKEITKRY